MWPAELGWAMNGVLRSDRAIRSRLQCGSARPICRLARGVVFARRCGLAEPTIHDGVEPSPLDLWGQAGILMGVHSVLRESLCQATSAFPVRTEWTTP
jgi:hypothetical protein